MAIGRLLSPKLNPHFTSRGFVPLTRKWFSSSPLQDGRKFESLPDSKASADKDIGQKGLHWYSLGGLLTNLKEKIVKNVSLINKTPDEGSVLSKSPMISSEDVTVKKVVSLQNVAEDKNCVSPSVKEESLVSEMGSQDVSRNVAGDEISGKTETTSTDKERNHSVDGLKFSHEKEWRLLQAGRVDLPEELSTKDVSLVSVTEEASESMVSSEENQGMLQPVKGQLDKKELPANKLSNMFVNLHPDKMVRPRHGFEALSNSNSSLSTRDSCRDAGDQHSPVQRMKKISNENDKQRSSDGLQKPDSLSSFLLSGVSLDGKSGDLPTSREMKTTFSFGSSRGTVVPLAVNRDLSIKKLMESLNVPTNNGTEADANSWNPNVGEGKCVSKGYSVTKKSDLFCVTEEEESKGLCSQASLAVTNANQESTKKSLDALSIEEHSPNKVVVRFLRQGCQKRDIVGSFSQFGAVLDVQEVPFFEGCFYTNALVTFETNSAVKKALKKGLVPVNHYSVIVEAVSQKDMVEKIRIPDLIGDPDVPTALVKEPTRTVKIHPLDHKICSNQIREALRFCKSDISKIIFGSSKTAAFIEFETEDGKERALAAHSIDILNKQLFISRIDIPRTTVARITNFAAPTMSDLRKQCEPYGQFKQIIPRGRSIADIRFDISEWPNMLTILNSMNGNEVDGMKWVVQPATTVIPHDILKVLWEDPQGKRYVKGLIKNMVREIEQPLDAGPLYSLYSTLED